MRHLHNAHKQTQQKIAEKKSQINSFIIFAYPIRLICYVIISYFFTFFLSNRTISKKKGYPIGGVNIHKKRYIQTDHKYTI